MSALSHLTDAATSRFADEDSSDHRIKIYKELSRLSTTHARSEAELDQDRRARDSELAAERHPRWRSTDAR